LTVRSGFVRICYIKGKVHVYPEGRYAINDPTFNVGEAINMQLQDVIQKGPVSVLRVKLGEFGFADDNAHPVVLTPGLHVYNDNTWRFCKFSNQNDEFIEHGPVKFVTVKSGYVRVFYSRGKASIYPEGRYGINDPTFLVGEPINMQQQNVRFEQHPVLLDGGVKMLVEGLLTYHVVDAEKVVRKIGAGELLRAISNVSKAELSHVFSTIHLEQVSTQTGYGQTQDPKDPKSLLGDQPRPEGESRSMICSHVVQYISPIVKVWGVEILNFQLESLKLADQTYSREYEEASLAMAKTKAKLRAQNATNDILLSAAEAKARAAKIEAEGQKAAIIIGAQAEAEARKIEAQARKEAAELMDNKFAQQLAMAGQQVEFARALKATVLTVIPESGIGRSVTSQAMFGSSPLLHDDRKDKK